MFSPHRLILSKGWYLGTILAFGLLQVLSGSSYANLWQAEGWTSFSSPQAAFKTIATDLNQTIYYGHFGSVLRLRPPYCQTCGNILYTNPTAGATLQLVPHPTDKTKVFIIDGLTNSIKVVNISFTGFAFDSAVVSDYTPANAIPGLHSMTVTFVAGQTRIFATGTDGSGNGVVYRVRDLNFNGDALDSGEIDIVANSISSPAIQARGISTLTPFSSVVLYVATSAGTVLQLVDTNSDGQYGLFPPERFTYATGISNAQRIAVHLGSGRLYVTTADGTPTSFTESKLYELLTDSNTDGQADGVSQIYDFSTANLRVVDAAFTVPFAPFQANLFAGNMLAAVHSGSLGVGTGNVYYLRGSTPQDTESVNGISSGDSATFFTGEGYEVALNFSSLSVSDVNITIRTYTGTPPYAGGAKVLNRWYKVEAIPSNATFSVDVTFGYLATDIPSGMTEDDIQGAFRYSGAQWLTQQSSVDTVNNQVTVTGISSFSLWAFGTFLDLNPAAPALSLFGTGVLMAGTTALLKRRRKQ